MKKLHRQCPICNNIYGTILRTVRMQLPEHVILPNEYDVICCDNCGFTYADVDASQDDYNLYYEDSNMYSEDAALKAKITGNREEMRYKILSEYVRNSDKILDVGCGGGGLLKYLRQKGFVNICGVDPSATSIKKIKENGIDGYVCNVFDPVPEELYESFDVVCFTAVLEHIYDLNFCIEQLSKYLKPDGLLYIEVPAVEGFEKVYRKLPNYFNHEHINYFSMISLDNLFAKHKFIRINPNNKCLGVLKGAELEITAIYKRSAQMPEVIRDKISERSIQQYLRQMKEIEASNFDALSKFLKAHQSPVVVWGVGAYAMQIVSDSPELRDKIEYFVDSNKLKVGKRLLGKMIYEPSKLSEDTHSYPIVICAMRNSQDIEDTIKTSKLQNPYFVL